MFWRIFNTLNYKTFINSKLKFQSEHSIVKTPSISRTKYFQNIQLDNKTLKKS